MDNFSFASIAFESEIDFYASTEQYLPFYGIFVQRHFRTENDDHFDAFRLVADDSNVAKNVKISIRFSNAGIRVMIIFICNLRILCNNSDQKSDTKFNTRG